MKPTIQTDNYTLYHGDCLEVLPTLAGGVDAVITDPPYGIDGGSRPINKARGKGNYSGIFDDTLDYLQRVVLKVILWSIENSTATIFTPGNKNFSVYPQPDSFGCFWHGPGGGVQVFGNVDSQPIFYYGKNATKKNLGKPCSFIMKTAPDKVDHPCRKPTKAWEQLILAHTLLGQVIIDPFMGSGTTGEICIKHGRKFIGIELDKGYFDIAHQRIANAAGDFVTTDKEKQTGQIAIWDRLKP